MSLVCSITQSCPTLFDHMDCGLLGFFVQGILQASIECHFLLQGLFLTQGWNLCLQHLLHWKVDSLPMSHLRSLAVQWWFLYYSFVNRGIQNYCGQCVVMCSGTEGSVSGYELCLSLSQTLFSFPVIHLKVAMWPGSGQLNVRGKCGNCCENLSSLIR